ncbi:hypothetical protein K7432_003157 [Basidiobolus ranarum]|uniref:Uncharacterized protein n=1 Tax=Basidiobolus ranarum TaxID=34480 RepID=A0ABR2W6Q4_9FUNG
MFIRSAARVQVNLRNPCMRRFIGHTNIQPSKSKSLVKPLATLTGVAVFTYTCVRSALAIGKKG